MRRRLLPEWVALWQYLGVRPSDVDRLTLDDALVVEVWAEEHRRERERAKAKAERERGHNGRRR